ncbi:ROK family protein [bacterium]|nr:ROK family protein [bacterium]
MNVPLRFPAPLDPGFVPAALATRAYRQAVAAAGAGVPLVIGLERDDGLVSRFEADVRPDGDAETLQFVERAVKFLVWARGGWKLHLAGPAAVADHLRRAYAAGGIRAFDADLMRRIYERPFEVAVVPHDAVPPVRESAAALGGHLDGCRLGFDLGASDYKLAAVQDGEVVYSGEFPWDPKNQADAQYHYDHLQRGLKTAAARLPRVDAIGGSSAGVIVGNRVMVASLFRSVPADRFDRDVRPLFLRLREQWGVSLEVLNDGDVTALAGGLSLGVTSVLGIAMGSSEAAGYLDAGGRLTGWLNELAFAPVDYQRQAAADEWSGDRGVGAQYFSQQAVNKLLSAAGITVPAGQGLPERLKTVQDLMAQDDPRAARVFETIGVYLGYAIPHYADFYDLRHLLVLGRVSSGRGGDRLVATARRVLAGEFPELAERIELHVPDEKSRRVGQAVAAASLPEIAAKP